MTKYVVIALNHETPEADYPGIVEEIGSQIYNAGVLTSLHRNFEFPVWLVEASPAWGYQNAHVKAQWPAP